MLRFEMIENNMDFVSYRYFPENDTLFGNISVRKADKTIIAQTIAENDEFKWCFSHLDQRIKEFIDKDCFEKQGTIIWY